MKKGVCIFFVGFFFAPLLSGLAHAETWRGLSIAAEFRCSQYDRSEYRYPASVESEIIARLGGRIYGPYSGKTFESPRQTDIEHIVAISEAHDSGMCSRSSGEKRQFARDLDNLTLASPSVNRYQKSGYDAGEWLPQVNQCWYVNQIILVKRKYNLTINQREASAIDRVLSNCETAAMQIYNSPVTKRHHTLPNSAPTTPNSGSSPLALWDDNNNGRITCAEARRHGIAPVYENHPAYRYMRDGDNDGVVCE